LNSEGLPANWSMQVAPNGRVFFIDHQNKVTTWIDPRTSKPSAVPGKGKVANKPAFTSVDDLGPLPDSWEERVHTDGRIFFIDHSTRTTQWEVSVLFFLHATSFLTVFLLHADRIPDSATRSLPDQLSPIPGTISESTSTYRQSWSNRPQMCQTNWRSESAGETYLKTRTASSAASPALICLRPNYGSSSTVRKYWIMGARHENGSICYPKKCLTLITAFSSTRYVTSLNNDCSLNDCLW
jgi:hypothetical protein